MTRARQLSRFVSRGAISIDSAYDVGIGTGEPGPKLHVYDATDNGVARFESGDAYAHITLADINSSTSKPYFGVQGDDFRFVNYSSTTGATEKIRITSDGLTGIGTNNPQKTLNVFAGVGTTEIVRLSQPVDANTQQEFGISWCSNNDHTWPGAQITSLEYDISDPRRDLLFYTRGDNSDSAPTERMRIESGGSVGIGTDNPSSNLHVFDDTLDADITVEATAAGKDGRLNLYGKSDGVSQIRFGDEDSVNIGLMTYNHSENYLALRTNSSERMRIDSTGRVLVGLTSAMTTGSNDRRDTIQAVHTAGAQLLLGRDDTANAVTNRLGEIAALANDANGVFEVGASIRFEVDAAQNDSEKPTAIIFKTCKDGTDDNYERIRISNFGGLGLPSATVGSASTDYGANNHVLTSQGNSTGVEWRGINGPAFFGTQDTSHNIPTNTYTVLNNFGNNVVNKGYRGGASGWNESLGIFTAPIGGTYVFYAGGGIDDLDANDYMQVVFAVNGTAEPPYARGRNTDLAGQITDARVTSIIQLSTNDTVEVEIWHNVGTTQPTEQNRCFFGGFRLSV